MEEPPHSPKASSPLLGECIVVCDSTLHDYAELHHLLDTEVLETAGARFLVPSSASNSIFNLLWLESTPELSAQSTATHYLMENSNIPLIYIGRHSGTQASVLCPSFISQSSDAATMVASLATRYGIPVEQGVGDVSAVRARIPISLALLLPDAERSSLVNFYSFFVELAAALVGHSREPCVWVIEATPKRAAEASHVGLLYSFLNGAPDTGRPFRIEQRVGPFCFVIYSAASLYWALVILFRGNWLNSNSTKWHLSRVFATYLSTYAVRPIRISDADRAALYRTAFMERDPDYNRKECCLCGARFDTLCIPCIPLFPVHISQTTQRNLTQHIDRHCVPSAIDCAAQTGDLRTLTRLTKQCPAQRRHHVLRVAALHGHAKIVSLLLDMWGDEIVRPPDKPKNSPSLDDYVQLGFTTTDLSEDVRMAGYVAIANQLLPLEKRRRKKLGLQELHELIKETKADANEKEKESENEKEKEEKEMREEEEEGKKFETVIKYYSVEAVKAFLANHRVDINAELPGGKGCTALHRAVERGNLELVQLLLSAHASPDHRNENYETPLQYAVRTTTSASAIPLLLQAGGNLHRVSRTGSTLLLEACQFGCVAAVQTLLAAGAKLGVTDANTNTPLLVASLGGHAEVVRVLIGAGVSLNEPDLWHTLAPLHVAARAGFADVARELIKGGADVDLNSKHGPPLVIACIFGRVEVVKALLQGGAKISSLYEGKTPLHYACKNGRLAVAQELLRAGAMLNVRSIEGYTEMHYAANSTPLLGFLIAAGSDPCAVSNTGITPLYSAASFGNLGNVEALLRAGAFVDAPCIPQQLTPLHAAARRPCPSVVQLLLEHGADPTATTNEGNTPLHFAAQKCSDTVRMLLRAGAIADQPNARGQSALHVAAQSSKAVIFQLLAAGANPARADADGKLPSEHARKDSTIGILASAAEAVKFGHPGKLR